MPGATYLLVERGYALERSSKSDEALMVDYQRGDEKGFDELYRRHSAKVYGYLRKRVSDRARTDELFQAIFMKLHESRAKYDSAYLFSPWLFTVCRSVLID